MSKEEKMIERRINLRHKIEFLQIILDSWLLVKFDQEYLAGVRKRLSYNKKLMEHMKDL